MCGCPRIVPRMPLLVSKCCVKSFSPLGGSAPSLSAGHQLELDGCRRELKESINLREDLWWWKLACFWTGVLAVGLALWGCCLPGARECCRRLLLFRLLSFLATSLRPRLEAAAAPSPRRTRRPPRDFDEGVTGFSSEESETDDDIRTSRARARAIRG